MMVLQKSEGATRFGANARRICPFVKETCDECLCSDTRSDSAEAAIRLCGGNFETCEIYQRKWREQATNH